MSTDRSRRVRPPMFASLLVFGLLVVLLAGVALSEQVKYSLRVPNGLPFADFRGYENWQVVAVSQTDKLLKVILANPIMIGAYRAGIPDNGQPFPDGSKIAKVEWTARVNAEAPYWVRVPDSQQDVALIEKDSRKYPATHGWAYAVFDYERASGSYAPAKRGTIDCGFACHTAVAKKDYIFTAYATR
jgi:hypothetical protein